MLYKVATTTTRDVIIREASHSGVNMRLHVYVTEKLDPSGRRGYATPSEEISWRPTEAGRSVPRLVAVIARVWRKRSITSDFPKTKRGSVYMFSIYVV